MGWICGGDRTCPIVEIPEPINALGDFSMILGKGFF